MGTAPDRLITPRSEGVNRVAGVVGTYSTTDRNVAIRPDGLAEGA
jgi:hypothetical protein